MNCPICGETLSKGSNGLYVCSQCSLEREPKEIRRLEHNLKRIDPILEAKKDELEYWEEIRILAIEGKMHLVEKLLTRTNSDPAPTSNINTSVGQPLRKKLGQMLASMEIAASIEWVLFNSYALFAGTIPYVQALVSVIVLIQGIILLVVSW